jgi:hypothetical protein
LSITAIWRNSRQSFFGLSSFALLAFTTFAAGTNQPVGTVAGLDELHGPVLAVAQARPEGPAVAVDEGPSEPAAMTPPSELTVESQKEPAGPGEIPAPVEREVPAVAVVPAPAVPSGMAWGARVSPAFRDEVRAMCGRLGCAPDHLMAAMAFESVETFSPAVKNPLSGATGLIQFMPETARLLGTNLDALGGLTAEEQLQYVEKYFQPFRGKLTTLEDIYMAILWPRAVGQPNDYVLFSDGSIQYAQNAKLDDDGDGVITKEETASLVNLKLVKGRRPAYQG